MLHLRRRRLWKRKKQTGAYDGEPFFTAYLISLPLSPLTLRDDQVRENEMEMDLHCVQPVIHRFSNKPTMYWCCSYCVENETGKYEMGKYYGEFFAAYLISFSLSLSLSPHIRRKAILNAALCWSQNEVVNPGLHKAYTKHWTEKYLNVFFHFYNIIWSKIVFLFIKLLKK